MKLEEAKEQRNIFKSNLNKNFNRNFKSKEQNSVSENNHLL